MRESASVCYPRFCSAGIAFERRRNLVSHIIAAMSSTRRPHMCGLFWDRCGHQWSIAAVTLVHAFSVGRLKPPLPRRSMRTHA